MVAIISGQLSVQLVLSLGACQHEEAVGDGGVRGWWGEVREYGRHRDATKVVFVQISFINHEHGELEPRQPVSVRQALSKIMFESNPHTQFPWE